MDNFVFCLLLPEKDMESKLLDIEKLKQELSEQPMSIEEITEIRKKYEYQEKENRCLQKEIEDYQSMISRTEALLTEKKDMVEYIVYKTYL